MAEKLRCGVIGTGGIGLEHLVSLTAYPRASAVAIAEVHPQRAREASERFRIPRSYSDYHDLLDQPDIDAVTIAVPNYLHAAIAIDALKARKHVLVEKPMATSAKDAARIVETAKKMKRTVMVAQNFRFNRHTQLARQIIDRGDLGEVYHARCFWLRRSAIPRIGSWFTQKQYAGGGCVCDIGVHLLDACLHLLKDFEVVSVSGHTHSKLGPRGLGEMNWGKSEINPQRPFDVEDFGAAFIKLKSGRAVTLEVCWAGFVPDDGREYGIDLLGTNAGLSLYPARLIRHTPDGYQTTHLNSLKLQQSEDRIHHFVSCVLEGRKPLVTPEESLKVQEVLDAIYASSSSGKEVRFK
jgi:predicted dehydrogenase